MNRSQSTGICLNHVTTKIPMSSGFNEQLLLHAQEQQSTSANASTVTRPHGGPAPGAEYEWHRLGIPRPLSPGEELLDLVELAGQA